MANAHSSENGAHEGDLRGAADAAPRSTTPLKLVEASIAGLEALVAEAQRLADDIESGSGHPAQSAVDLLTELRDSGLQIASPEEEHTYRLLAGVMSNNPLELRTLRERTIAPLEAYDSDHDTELAMTLECFLTHHGSTTDTAEAMQLHRHTVGYRLARIQEVCGLSPYESEGRERLSLGLKARRLLLAEERRSAELMPDGGPAGPTAPGLAS
jgi:DNA-binding PucR family transcriptional regulator